MKNDEEIIAPKNWWDDKAGFFGSGYMAGDDSISGYSPDVERSLDERTSYEVDGVVDLLNLNSGSSILDVPCGYGRHTLELFQRGFEVVGVDINDCHIGTAKGSVFKRYLNLRNFEAVERYLSKLEGYAFMKRDMRALGSDLYGNFDAVLNMFFSFGFFDEERDNERVMDEFHKALRPGGQLLIHTHVCPEFIEKNGIEYSVKDRNLQGGGKLHIEERFNKQNRRLEGKWSIENDTVMDLTPYSVRLYTASEFESMAEGAGFSDVNVYGSFNGDDFNEDSPLMLVVAQKV